MFSREFWTSTSSPSSRKSGFREATPIVPDFGILDGPGARRVPLLERGILGYAKLPCSLELRDCISKLSGKSVYSEDELAEIFALASVRMTFRLLSFGVRWAAVAYLFYASLIWSLFVN